MALYIVNKDGTEKQFYVPFKSNMNLLADDVVKIQADGDELEEIRYKFTTTDSKKYKTGYSIPMSLYGRVMIWYGDIAKTIIANL